MIVHARMNVHPYRSNVCVCVCVCVCARARVRVRVLCVRACMYTPAYLVALEGSNMSIFGRNINSTDINGFARGGWGLVHAFSNLNLSFSNLASNVR